MFVSHQMVCYVYCPCILQHPTCVLPPCVHVAPFLRPSRIYEGALESQMICVHEAATKRLVSVQDAHPEFFKLNKARRNHLHQCTSLLPTII
jgi:hypothetical protein